MLLRNLKERRRGSCNLTVVLRISPWQGLSRWQSKHGKLLPLGPRLPPSIYSSTYFQPQSCATSFAAIMECASPQYSAQRTIDSSVISSEIASHRVVCCPGTVSSFVTSAGTKSMRHVNRIHHREIRPALLQAQDRRFRKPPSSRCLCHTGFLPTLGSRSPEPLLPCNLDHVVAIRSDYPD